MIKLETINNLLSKFGILLIVQYPINGSDAPIIFFIETVKGFNRRAGNKSNYEV